MIRLSNAKSGVSNALGILVTVSAALSAVGQDPETPRIPPPVEDLRQIDPEVLAPTATATPVSVNKLLAENQALRIQMSELIQSGVESESLRQQNESLREEITNLAAKVLELDRMKARTEERDEEISALREQSDRLKAAEDEIRSLRVQLAGTVETASQLQTTKGDIEKLRSREKELIEQRDRLLPVEEENRELRIRVASLEGRIAGLVEAESEAARLREEVSTLRSEKDALVKETQEQSLFLKQQLETLKLKNQAFTEADKNRKELIDQVRQLQERTLLLEANNREIEELRKEVARLRSTGVSESIVDRVTQESIPSPTRTSEIVGAPVVTDSAVRSASSEKSSPEEEAGTGFTRYEQDSGREALEQRIREEIERRRAYQDSTNSP